MIIARKVRASVKAVASLLILVTALAASASAADSVSGGAAKKMVAAQPSDYEAIRNLANAYFDAVWRQDVDAYMATFAPDGEFVLYGMQMGSISAPHPAAGAEPTQSFKGQTAIRDAISAALPKSNALPLGHNHVIVLDSPTQAHGTIMSELLSGADFKMQTMVYYRDTYVKIAGSWKLLRREAHTMGPGTHP